MTESTPVLSFADSEGQVLTGPVHVVQDVPVQLPGLVVQVPPGGLVFVHDVDVEVFLSEAAVDQAALSELQRRCIPTMPLTDPLGEGVWRMTTVPTLPAGAFPLGLTVLRWTVTASIGAPQDPPRPLAADLRIIVRSHAVLPPDRPSTSGPAEGHPKEPGAAVLDEADGSAEDTLVSVARGEHSGWFAMDFGTSNSTVTVFDPTHGNNLVGLSNTHADHLRERLRTLWDGAATEQQVDLPHGSVALGPLPVDWRRLLTDAVPEDVGGDPAEGPDPLVGDGLYSTLRAVERHIDQMADLATARQARVSLHELYRESLAEPLIEEQRFIRIPLHAEDLSISSDVDVISLRPLRVRLERDSVGSVSTLRSEVRYQPGLKRFLGNNQLLPGLADNDPLVRTEPVLAATWHELVEKAHTYLGAGGRAFCGERLRHAVVTYPATSPPQTRLDAERLCRQLGMRRINSSFDEATAAAMFHIMCEISGDPVLGAEVFRARCRQIGTEWHRNILVIDVGGGSTDIALIGLVLRDKTEFERSVDHASQGRYYELTPTILGKAGHPQLGGDRITLGIFKALKTALAHKLLAGGIVPLGEHPPFVSQGRYERSVLDSCPKRVEQERRDGLVEAVVQTRWAVAGLSDSARDDAHNRFRQLWDLAEKAKRAPRDGRPHVVQDVAHAMAHLPELKDIEGADRIELGAPQLAGPIDDVVGQIAEIAADVAADRLPRGADGCLEPLDLVILSGGSSALPEVAAAVQRELTDPGSHHRSVIKWNPRYLQHYCGYTKAATSVGACWAEQVRQKGFATAEIARPRVVAGHVELAIDVRNLFHSLPHTIVRTAAGGGEPDQVFPTGAEFEFADAEGTLTIRSPWFEPHANTHLMRQPISGAEQRDEWAHLNLDSVLATVPGEEVHHTRIEQWRAMVRTQFEIDDRGRVRAFFAHRTDKGLALAGYDGTAGRDVPLASVGGSLFTADEETGRIVLRGDIVVSAHQAGGLPGTGQPVFRAGTEATSVLSRGGTEKACLTPGRLPRDLPREGCWELCWMERGVEGFTRLAIVHPIIKGGTGPDTYLLLDVDGRMSSHVGAVPYLAATDPWQATEPDGRVFTIPMDTGERDLDERFDAFSGRH